MIVNTDHKHSDDFLLDRVLTDDEARSLTEAFFAGTTTVEQEERLTVYYATARVAPDLQRHRSVMLWMASGCPELPARKRKEGWWRLVSARFGRVASAAAVVALLVTAAVDVTTSRRSLDELRQEYAGSYVLRHGERVTDLPTVIAKMNAAQTLAEQIEAAHKARVDRVLRADSLATALTDKYWNE